MAESLKQEAAATWTPQDIPSSSDWRSRGLEKVPTEAECDALRLPFAIYPETVDCYDSKYTTNLKHLVAGQEPGTPWTGYYATFNGAKLAVSNMFGAWFEIERRDETWQAIRLTHTELKVQGKALPGLNTRALIETGAPTNAELIERAQSASRASQHDPPPHQDPPAQPPNTPVAPSSDLGCYLPGGLGNCHPAYRDNNDDPFSSNTA
jgi:hypothetical protein